MPSNKSDYMSKYYKANKDKYKERSKLRYTCQCCNIDLSYCNKSAHEKTRKHKTKALQKKMGGKLDQDVLAMLADALKTDSKPNKDSKYIDTIHYKKFNVSKIRKLEKKTVE